MTMRTASVYTVLSLGLMLVSFTPPGAPSAPAFRSGTYGVCACEGREVNASSVALALEDDQRFHFVDRTDSKNLMDVSGIWAMDGDKVALRTTDGALFATWTMDKNTNCLRTRKGLLFTRLCHLEACK